MPKRPPQTTDVLVEISSKLDKILKLLALAAVKESKKEKEKIELLDSAGFTSSEIGKILDKSTENVCTVLKSLKDKPLKLAKKDGKNVQSSTEQSLKNGESAK